MATVTLLFTDIESSTRLLQHGGRERYVRALEAHRQLLRDSFQLYGGVEVEMQGDSFLYAFASAQDAAAAAASGQRAVSNNAWDAEPVRVRMGIPMGEPLLLNNLYAGLDAHRVRIHVDRVMLARLALTASCAEPRPKDWPRQSAPGPTSCLCYGCVRLKLVPPAQVPWPASPGTPWLWGV